nr:nodulin homeobox isoform X1 [Ipomoea batatas]
MKFRGVKDLAVEFVDQSNVAHVSSRSTVNPKSRPNSKGGNKVPEMRLSKEEATCSAEPASTSVRRAELPLDLVSAVKGLHTLGSQELSRLIRDAENNILRHSTQNGSSVQVDLEKLARHLSLHLIAVIMARETNEALLKYLLSGFQLLHSLGEYSFSAS